MKERTPSRPLFPWSTKDLTAHGGSGPFWVVQKVREGNSHILAALAHSLGRGWGSGVFSFMGDERQVCDGVGSPSLDLLHVPVPLRGRSARQFPLTLNLRANVT